jgi:VanZ family protein
MTQTNKDNTPSGRPGIASPIQKKLGKVNGQVMGPKLLGVVCGMVLAGLLVAGLWPFHSPKNQVTWLAGGNGLHIGKHGTILCSEKFQAPEMSADAPCSLEIWLEPAVTEASGTLLVFYAPGNPRQFSLEQSLSDLALRSDVPAGRYRTRATRLYIERIFRQGKPLFITVTSSGVRTSVYINGVLAKTSGRFPFSRRDFDGELIIATSPVNGHSWSGLLRGLAFYNQDITPAQVSQHYTAWTTNGRPVVSDDERAVALYLFDEHAGGVIHNQVASGFDLNIPDRYLVLDQSFLKPFWTEYRADWSYVNDLLINIVGFVPFGFLVCAYLSLAGRSKRPVLATILLGFAVSLTIETLQAFLPTRDSGTTDLITNTSGTALGAWLYGCNFWRPLWIKIWTHSVGIAESN